MMFDSHTIFKIEFSLSGQTVFKPSKAHKAICSKYLISLTHVEKNTSQLRIFRIIALS